MAELNGEKEIKLKSTIDKILTITEKDIDLINKKIVKYHDSINESSSILLEVKEFLKKYHVNKNDDFIGYSFDHLLNLSKEEIMTKQSNYILQWVTKQKK